MSMNAERKRSRWLKLGLFAVLVCILLFLLLHHKPTNVTSSLPAPVVIVQKPTALKMAEYVTQTGNLVAYNSVNLVARVEGYLKEIKFKDGSFVEKGQELFVIEPDPYQEKVAEAKAQLEATKAAALYNETEYARQKQMYRQNATSLKNVEKWLAKSEESKAEISKAQANLQVAEVNYSYTRVLAPFHGRIGRHLVDPGNLVGNGKATNLATLEQINPIYAYFNLNELDLIKIRKIAKKRGLKPEDINQIPVYVAMQNERGFPHQGKLDFVNTGLNASTGTMEFRALLPNANFSLLPGLFVQVRIPVTEAIVQLTIPDTAILYDQIGSYVLVADETNHVILKRVVLGSVEHGMRAITKGIDANDHVIIEGLQNAAVGIQVAPQIQQTRGQA
ncbi:RND multidrug efflux membrane fusion protein [Legionella jordanis]|uniref:RND multidrug efflux membrane fusion protein n=2 Tax=Legionella jordanis TaxID=456 RepID=A0A0W0VDU0_9GAMM|nr:RND multidrug efflux membrane fusion protein [Legionella jordanis]VEH13372.1 RND multidrug efflux membrane fusion protein [Legionella jordanis]